MAPKKSGSKQAPSRGSPTPEPPKADEPDPAEVAEEHLQGEFAFEDGSTYAGHYVKAADGALSYHGEGLLHNGPETFQGTFERGLYKAGRLQCRSGAVYEGSFRGGLYHGAGVYTWPGGRAYHGTWKDGRMHGRGCFVDFVPGEAFEGFCLDGDFCSDPLEQKEAKSKFLAEYNAECSRSACAALRAIADGMAADGVPPDCLASGQEAEAFVAGPFPEAADVPQDALRAFAALLDKEGNPSGAPQPDSPSALHVNVLEEADKAWHLEGGRPRLPQLRVVGQIVEIAAPAGEADNPIRAIVLVNMSQEFDLALARWKLVHVEVERSPTE